MLKICYRQYQQYSKVQTMLKNNLISLLDTTFPDANRLFTSPPRADGSEKWVDFVATFWHCECVCGRSEKAFTWNPWSTTDFYTLYHLAGRRFNFEMLSGLILYCIFSPP